MNRDGSVRFTYEINSSYRLERPLISLTVKYIVILSNSYDDYSDDKDEVILFDGNTGEILEYFEDLWGLEFFFTPNERYLCILAGSPLTVTLYDCWINSVIWSREFNYEINPGIRYSNCDNEAEYLQVSAAMPDPLHQSYSAYLFNFVLDDISITESTPQIAHISPEASFIVMQMNTIWQIGHQDRSLPLVVSRLAGGE